MSNDGFTTYALYSPDYEKIYIGFTGDLEARLLSHNKLGKKGWTIKYRPWELVYQQRFATKPEAMKREKELKSAKGRQFIWSIIEENFSE
jgi:putative endonuclease